jgi:hypothetical protein
MKKILLITATVIVALALTPLVSKKFVESEINNQVEKLASSGLSVEKQTTDSTYLSTKKHFEFVVNDADRFSDYLSSFSNRQIAPYVKTLFSGITVGVDLDYNNIPILNTVAIDIYPISLSPQTMNDIKKEDRDFGVYLEKFLSEGGLFYHIDLDVVTNEFSGHIKDIKESYTFKSSHKLDAQLLESTFSGKGPLIAPEFIDSTTKKIYLDIRDKASKITVDMQDVSISSKFESRTTYSTDIELSKLDMDFDKIDGAKTKLNITKPSFSFSSSTKGVKAKIKSLTSFDKIKLMARMQELNVEKFNLDFSIGNIDKDSYEELSRLVNSTSDKDLNLEVQKQMREIAMRGFDLDIKDISVKNITINNTKDLKSASLKANIKLPQNVATSNVPINQMMDKLDVDMLLNISKPMFIAITRSAPIVALSQGFAKEQGDSLIYDVKMNKGSLVVNGKKIR